MWIWPLQSIGRTWPDAPGLFGARRTHDFHTGVDLYCNEGTGVVAVEPGRIVAIEDFTGEKAGSPWWRDTSAILVRGSSGVVCYGEVDVAGGLQAGETVEGGQVLGLVKTVLKADKGRPMTMLHVELYEGWVVESVWWRLEEARPPGLLDPTNFLRWAFFDG